MGRRVEIVPERSLAREVDASREAMASNRRETKSGDEKVWFQEVSAAMSLFFLECEDARVGSGRW